MDAGAFNFCVVGLVGNGCVLVDAIGEFFEMFIECSLACLTGETGGD